VVDEQFIRQVSKQQFPQATQITGLEEAGLDEATLLELFRSQVTSRQLDLAARWLKEQNQGFYTIGSSGHEGNAVLGRVFPYTDMAFLHYRSGAFVVERAKQLPEINIIKDICLSLCASKEDPIARGRHKVFGSRPLNIPPQTSTIASHLPKAVGAAWSIASRKSLHLEDNSLKEDGVVICSFGDASLNHSTTQGALNSAEWISAQGFPLPLVFLCEDNGLGISVPTPASWVEEHMRGRRHFEYIYGDGLHLPHLFKAAKEAEHSARTQKNPVFLHMKTVRLLGHAGSDIESHYLHQNAIEQQESQDPLLHSARILLEENILDAQGILDTYEDIRTTVMEAANNAKDIGCLDNPQDIMASIIPPKNSKPSKTKPNDKERETIFGSQWKQLSEPRNLCQNLNASLTDTLLAYPNAVMFGEDVGKKGGVYRVTADLQKRFSQKRIFDSVLDEQTILGTAIGMAHNGLLPIPEIQFLAYLHNAQDQLRGEAATLSFFSDGQYTNPMVIRIAALGYQKGFGGHFHNDNSIAILRDLPGVIVACPSRGDNAVKLWRECVRLADEEQRVVVFLEPIALYMTKDLNDAGDGGWLSVYPKLSDRISLGEVEIEGSGKDLAIVTYGNGHFLSTQAKLIIEKETGMTVRIVNLLWLAPLPKAALLKAVSPCNNILIVDEGRQSGSVSEGLITLFHENGFQDKEIRRITGKDCFIPLGTAWEAILPSRDDIVEQSLVILGEGPGSQEKNEFL